MSLWTRERDAVTGKVTSDLKVISMTTKAVLVAAIVIVVVLAFKFGGWTG